MHETLGGMHEFTLPLPVALWRELEDLADATGRRPEDIALDAVRHQVAQEASRVRVTAESLAGAHAGLLRRLGE
jgi:predicted transcriptional regulator